MEFGLNFIENFLNRLRASNGYQQKYVKEAFDTNWVVPLGPNVNGFEDDLKVFVSKNSDGSELSREVVALSAGTAAVHLGLLREL